MIDYVEFCEHIQNLILLLVVLVFLWNPLYTLILLAIAFFVRKKKQAKKEYLFILIVLLLAFALICNTHDIIYILPRTWHSYLFKPFSIRMMASIVITLICIIFPFGSTDKWMIRLESRKQGKIYSDDNTLDFSNRSHTFICGTTGSGKSQLIERYIKDSLENREPLYIISGKGSNDKNSLLDDVINMCTLYNRKLYIVSMNPERKQRVKYNPLKNYTSTEIADALVNASIFTEPHYKYNLSAWVKLVYEVMDIADVPIHLESLLYFLAFPKFELLLTKLVNEKVITPETSLKYSSYKDLSDIASSSRARFLNILIGEGKDIIGDCQSISADDVRKENAVLFLDLDSFKYTDFTQVIGALFINDMRHLIATEHNHSPKRIIMDELSCYVTEQIMPLFSQSRSFGYQLVVATQSIADIDNVNEKLSVRILENCGQYGILQLNSADDAEQISKLIGTTIDVETTRKSAGNRLHPTADGSKKVVNTFKVSPDTIKELEPLEVIFYDKKSPHTVKRIKMKYGWQNS